MSRVMCYKDGMTHSNMVKKVYSPYIELKFLALASLQMAAFALIQLKTMTCLAEMLWKIGSRIPLIL
jgi:hypothetical protein